MSISSPGFLFSCLRQMGHVKIIEISNYYNATNRKTCGKGDFIKNKEKGDGYIFCNKQL